MSFEVSIIGTSGMMPLPGRFLTSCILRRNGRLMLFDCGEGTQVSLKIQGFHWKKISDIFITHMHADHVTGLAGLMMLSSQVERTEPLNIWGPAKLEQYIEANRKLLDMYINYPVYFHAVEPGVILEDEEIKVSTVPLLHTKPCFGYVLEEKPRPGEFHPEMAMELGVPRGPMWGMLQHGQSVRLEDGRVVESSQVMGQKRDGCKFAYVTDTLYLGSIADYVKNADLLICESMFESALLPDATQKRHMTATQAAMIALSARVKSLGLTHYSPRYSEAELGILLKEAQAVFPNTFLCKEKQVIEITSED
ncbi:MAG: ribonuclease Z [Sphaerochaetaceae bacterium]|jgi:ribonuclease Z